MPTYASQCKNLKHTEHFTALGTGKAQAVLQKLNEAWNSFWALKKLQARGQLPPNIKKVRPPGYLKDRGTKQTILRSFYIRNDCYRVKDRVMHIAKQLKIAFAVDRLRDGKKGRLEVMYDRLKDAWYAIIPVDSKPTKLAASENHKVGSIDLGVCNLVAFYTPNEQPLIYSGRAVLSDWVYHTKKIAELQSKLPERNRTSRRIGLFFRKRTRHFRHAVRAMLKDVFERMKNAAVTRLVVGDLTGIRDNNNLGRHTNQKNHNFWSHRQSIEWIKHLCEDYGIAFSQVSEYNTSRTCCLCGRQHNGRRFRGLHVCGKQMVNSDVCGAVNIWNVAVNGTLLPTTMSPSSSRRLASPLVLRWNYDHWQ